MGSAFLCDGPLWYIAGERGNQNPTTHLSADVGNWQPGSVVEP
jgi:hypothetical protein